MMSDRTLKRGRLYSCLHCEMEGQTYHEAKYRVEGHVLKHHVPLNQTKFYCTLCLFRCTTMDKLKNHVTKYKRHLANATGVQDHSVYLRHNPRARDLVEGVDYRVLSTMDQACSASEDPTAEDSMSDLDMMDLGFSSGASSSSTTGLIRNDTAVQNTSSMQGQNLISVQLTQEQLALFLNQQPAARNQELCGTGRTIQVLQPSQPAAGTGLTTASPSPHASSLQPNHSLRQTVGVHASVYNLGQHPCLQSLTAPLMSTSPQIQLPDCQAKEALIATPLLDERVKKTPVEQLDTPKISEFEDLRPQLLEGVPSTPLFTPTRTAQVLDKECQTDLEPEAKRQRIEFDTSSIETSLMSSLAGLTSMVQSNARAVRNQDKTLGEVVLAIQELSKTIERVGNQISDSKNSSVQPSRQHSRLEKENQPPAQRYRSPEPSRHSRYPRF